MKKFRYQTTTPGSVIVSALCLAAMAAVPFTLPVGFFALLAIAQALFLVSITTAELARRYRQQARALAKSGLFRFNSFLS